MTVEEAAFLAKVLTESADDTHRLVYADWLDENGRHERAEFIRVQVALASQEDADGWVLMDDAATRLMDRERELLEGPRKDYWPLWRWVFGQDAENDMPDGWVVTTHAKMRRGFLEQLTCPADSWVKNGDAIRTRHPVARVRLTTLTQFDQKQNPSAREDLIKLPGDPADRWFSATEIAKTAGGRNWIKAVAELRWPGITFELPNH